MIVSNILEVGLQLTELNGEVSQGFLEVFIGILIGAVGITGLGIILYCLILKLVTLPLDVWQKVSMRKQSLKMEEMRGQLEKLQKQYANNQELYQKKIQEVYKENNYNLFSSCVPMIVTLVILIFAFQSLTAYSQYRNLQIYTDMNAAYNAAVTAHCDLSQTPVAYVDSNGVAYDEYPATGAEYYISCRVNQADRSDREYFIDVDEIKTNEAYQAYKQSLGENAGDDESVALDFVKNTARNAAAESYRNDKNNEGFSFLWVKNIYYPDVAWSHPVQKYSDFTKSITKTIVLYDRNPQEEGKVKVGEVKKVSDFISEGTYNEITANLEEEKTQPNGFFILVALTILINLGSQFVTMRSQKAQRELQSADKSQQNMQKYMMFLMPAMFMIFAFIYSGAFSLYLITSSLFSLLSTLIVNQFIDRRFKAKAQAAAESTGRVNLSRDWKKNEALKNEKNKNKKQK